MAQSKVSLVFEGKDQGASAAAESVAGSLGGLSGGLGALASPAGLAAGAVAAVGGAAVAAGVELFNASQDVDKAMNQFRAETGLGGDLKAFEEAATSIFASNWGENISDVTVAMAEMKRQTDVMGVDALEQLTTDALILRDVFGIEITESANSANALMEEFGLTGQQAMDFITKGMQSGLNNSDDFLDSIGEYSNLFADAGFSAAEMYSIMETGAASGVLGTDKIADAVKEMNIRLNEGAKGVPEAFDAIGLSFEDISRWVAAGDETWRDYFPNIIDGLNSIEDPLERNKAQVAIFGTMAEDLGPSFIEGLSMASTSLEDMAGSTAAAGDAVSQGLGPAWETFKRETLVALLPIGDMIGEALGAATPYLADFGAWLGEKVPLAVATLKAGWEETWPGIQGAVQTAWDFIYPTVLQPLMAWFAEEGPVALETLRVFWVEQLWPELQATIESVWNFVNPNILQPLKAWFAEEGPVALETLRAFWVDVVWPGIQVAVENAWNNFKVQLHAIREFFDVTLPETITAAKNTWDSSWQAISSAVNTAWDTLGGIFESIRGFADWLSGYVFDFNFNLPELPDWATPGSPIPLHTRWKDFGDYLRTNDFEVNFRTNAAELPDEVFGSRSGSVGGGGGDNAVFAPAGVSAPVSGGITYIIEKIVVQDERTGRLLLDWLQGIDTNASLASITGV